MKLQIIIFILLNIFMISSCSTTPEIRECRHECERNIRACSDSCRESYREYMPDERPGQQNNFSSMRSYDCMSRCDKQYYNCLDRCNKPVEYNKQP